ncbi:MAG: DUF5011 domain-containing protein [Candidatus Kerfeldbacteria bacterium]|nr:DUF5011 domain-containing protein [Candidatus Kerfeldbacteria bacterium]
MLPSGAAAATYTVTKITDSADGTCNSDCSLREAVIAANNAAGSDSITLAEGTYTLSIAGQNEDAAAQGDIDITSTITITGISAEATLIDADEIDGVFHVTGGGDLTLQNLTVMGGNNVSNGGGIYSQNILNISNCTIRDNGATDSGGGIYAVGTTVMITNAIVRNNTITASSDGIGGGGIYTGASTSEMENSIVRNNSVTTTNGVAVGGGVKGPLTIRNSLIQENTVTATEEARGGGLSEPWIVVNTTIIGNSATGGDGTYGGGIASVGGALYFVTLTQNTVTATTGTATGASLGIAGGALLMKGSIIDDDANSNCYIDSPGGVLTSLGYNIELGDTCELSEPTDLNNTDPLLENALADNGGSTQSIAIQTGSPAEDLVPSIDCTDDTTDLLTQDQRGFTRPDDTNCDAGAYERDGVNPIITMTNDTTDVNTIECSVDTFTDPGATVTDNSDDFYGTTLSLQTTGNVDEQTAGTYTMTYTATDAANNTNSATRTITVEDTIAPSLQLSGETQVSIEEGTTYTDAGVVVSDLCDASVTVISSNSVNTAVPGVYSVVYTANDDSTNSTTATRTVTVTAAPATPSVTTVTGAKNGKITVMYDDDSTTTYTIFTTDTDKETLVTFYTDTEYVIVLHPKGKKMALVNPSTGEVYSTVTLSDKKKYGKNAMKQYNVREDQDTKTEMIVTSKKDNAVKLSIVSVNIAELALKKKDAVTYNNSHVNVSKTKTKSKTITLRNTDKETLQAYHVSKKYALSEK